MTLRGWFLLELVSTKGVHWLLDDSQIWIGRIFDYMYENVVSLLWLFS